MRYLYGCLTTTALVGSAPPPLDAAPGCRTPCGGNNGNGGGARAANTIGTPMTAVTATASGDVNESVVDVSLK